MKSEKIAQCLAWALVGASVVFSIWATPKALNWWQGLVSSNTAKIEIILTWDYPKNEPNPERFQIFRNTKLVMVTPGTSRKARVFAFKHKLSAFEVCAHNFSTNEIACTEVVLFDP